MPAKAARVEPEASGDWGTITKSLRAVVRGELDFEIAWDAIVKVGRRVAAATEQDPLALLRCAAGPVGSEPRPVDECV